jgi:hypothetical protein
VWRSHRDRASASLSSWSFSPAFRRWLLGLRPTSINLLRLQGFCYDILITVPVRILFNVSYINCNREKLPKLDSAGARYWLLQQQSL